jgi:O-antigen/teichoic acid export membrane protein
VADEIGHDPGRTGRADDTEETATGGSLFRSFVSVFSGRAVVLLVTIVFTPLLVRVLTPVEFGVFATVMAVFVVVEQVSKGGLFDAMANQVAKYARGSRAAAQASLVGVTLAGAYGVASTVLLVGAVLLGPVPAQYRPYLLLLSSALFVGNLFTAIQGVYYGRRQESVAERVGVLWQVLYAGLALSLAVVGFGLTGVFAGYVAATAVAAVLLGARLVRDVDVAPGAVLGALRAQGRPVAAFGAVQTVGSLAGILLHRTDILLVNAFRGVTDSGIYRAALLPAEVVWFVPFVIQLSLLQNASDHWSRGDVDSINADTATSFKYAFLALTLFGVGLFGLAEEFAVVYFGPAYADAARPLRLLLVGAFLFGVSRAFTPTLKATGYNVPVEVVTVVGLIVNLGLNLLLIPRFGITGAAVGTAVSYGAMLAGSLAVWSRTPFGFPSLREVARLTGVLVGFAVPYLLVLGWLPFGPVGTILTGAAVGGVLFLVVVVATGVVTRSEVVALRE